MKKLIALLVMAKASITNLFSNSLAHFDERFSDTFDNIHQRVAGGLQHFDEDFEEGFEDFDSTFDNLETEYYEKVEHYSKNKQYGRTQAAGAADRFMTNKHGNKWSAAKKGITQKRAGLVKAGGRNSRMVAQFNLVITRTSSGSINQQLPFALFGSAHLVSNYSQILGGYIPNGLTLAVTQGANGVTFSYSDGAGHTDTITVSCNEVPYSTFLQECITDVVRMYKNRYIITNTNDQTNFQNNYFIVQKTMFGQLKQMPITIQSFFPPDQFQTNRVDIDAECYADKDRCVVHLLNPQSGGGAGSYTVSMGFFVSSYDRYGASKSYGS